MKKFMKYILAATIMVIVSQSVVSANSGIDCTREENGCQVTAFNGRDNWDEN